MHLRHLGLPVRDLPRSVQFYSTYFGFDVAGASTYPDGTLIVRDADGFDLALHPVDVLPDPSAFLHFGFTMPDAPSVRELKSRMETDGIRVVEHDEEPGLVSFKCLDPDGWRVEAYWELPYAGATVPTAHPGATPEGGASASVVEPS